MKTFQLHSSTLQNEDTFWLINKLKTYNLKNNNIGNKLLPHCCQSDKTKNNDSLQLSCISSVCSRAVLWLTGCTVAFHLRSTSRSTCVCPSAVSLSQIFSSDKIVFAKPLPRQIYCWLCCGLVCLSITHVMVWNPPFIS